MAFYIHYADPGFPDPPWPGERRLGPFLTLEEARRQAVENSAVGYGDALGIWDEDSSEKFRADDGDKPRRPKAERDASTLRKQGRNRAKVLAKQREGQRKADTMALTGTPAEQITELLLDLQAQRDDEE